MADEEPPLAPEVLMGHICIYCHQNKGSVVAANSCEKAHEREMTSSQLHQRHTAYTRKFLRRSRKKD
jgi:hypothetical protein